MTGLSRRRRRQERYRDAAAFDDLVEAYNAGATISQLAVAFGAHRTTVAGHPSAPYGPLPRVVDRQR